MIRVSKADGAALIEKRWEAKRARWNKDLLPENILERQMCDFLRAHGWSLTRNHVGTFIPLRVLRNGVTEPRGVIRIGETGMADWRAERPILKSVIIVGSGMCELFYFETKAPGKRPSFAQAVWLEAKRRSGFEAEWFDYFGEDHLVRGASCFMEWYRERFR